MKNLAFILVICISTLSFSQNWTLISTDKQYHYFQEDVHPATIKVDSMDFLGDDVMFYLNRIVVECDTCEQSWLPYFLYNQPNFLQKKVLLQDSVFRFLDTNAFAIRPYAPVGTNWMFDTINNINASIIGASMVTTFGESDSLKLISLSNGYSIILSKNFGIKSFQVNGDEPEFQLKGVQGVNDYGYYVPDMDDYYDYQVGDVFNYSRTWVIGDPDNTGGTSYYYQIKSLEHTDSTIVMNVDKCSNVNPNVWPFDYQEFYNTELVIEKFQFANSLLGSYNSIEPWMDWDMEIYTKTKISLNENVIQKSFETFMIDTFSIEGLARRAEYQEGYLTFQGKSFNYQEYGFEYGYDYVNNYIGNSNVDSFSCNYLFHSVPEIKVNEHFSIAPNPANEKITINRGSVLEPYEITVFNLQGQLVQSDTWKAGIKAKSLNVASLPKGMYLIKFYSKNQLVGEEKFVKID
jgi:hypothetical protein